MEKIEVMRLRISGYKAQYQKQLTKLNNSHIPYKEKIVDEYGIKWSIIMIDKKNEMEFKKFFIENLLFKS